MLEIRSHPYASINWIRFIGLASVPLVKLQAHLSAQSSTPLRKLHYITNRRIRQASAAGGMVKFYRQTLKKTAITATGNLIS